MKCEAADDEEEVVAADAEVDLAAVLAVLLRVGLVDLLKVDQAVPVAPHQLTRQRVVVLGSSQWRA